MVLGQGRHSKEEKSSRDVRVGRGEVKEGHLKLHCHKSRVLGAAGGCCSRWEQVSFCHSDTSYSPWRKRTSVEELSPSDRTVKNFLDCWLVCEGPAHLGQCYPGVVLGCIRKEAEQATGSKSVSHTPP